MSVRLGSSFATFCAALLACATASADPPANDAAPVSGFMLQARFNQILGAPMLLSGSGLSTLPHSPLSPAALGYRGVSWALGFAPTFWSLDRTGSTSDGTKVFGLTVHGEFVVARFLHGAAEAYLAPGFSLLFLEPRGGGSTEVVWGFSVGGGGRYWITRGLGVQIELAESILSLPTSGDERDVLLHTTGTLGMTLVLGDG